MSKEIPCRKCGHVWLWVDWKKHEDAFCPEGYGCNMVGLSDRIKELEAKRIESLTALRTLERWFDTDQEIIDNMTQDEAFNHKQLHNMLKATIAKVSQCLTS